MAPPTQGPVKVLLCGQVDGNWGLVWERARKLNAGVKPGQAPFSLLLCIGRALPFPEDYLTGRLTVPLPTYVVPAAEDLVTWESAEGEHHAPLVAKIREASLAKAASSAPLELFPNCFALASCGVVKLAGLTVGYLAGMEATVKEPEEQQRNNDAVTFTSKDVERLQQAIEAEGQDLDFLLTAPYPAHFQHLVGDQPAPEGLRHAPTSAALGPLVRTIAPRYHITSAATGDDHGAFYQRLPYLTECPRSGRKLVTRLIGLCGVNASKDKTKKYLHALQITPAAAASDAVDVPVGTTQNPYEQFAQQQERRPEPAAKRQRTGDDRRGAGLSAEQVAQLTAQSGTGNQFFYDQKIAQRGQHPDALRHPPRHGHDRQPRPHVPERTECWFCLATPSVERHLIASIGLEAYLAVPKGAINEDHLLIVPIAHEASTTRLSPSCAKEVTRFKDALRRYFDAQDKDMIVFDRNILTVGATHCHLQVVGVPRALAGRAQEVFAHEGDKYNVKFQELTPDDELATVTEGRPYFYAEIPDGQGGIVRLLNFVEAKQYMQFGRHAAACVLDMPRRANWKYCVLPKPEEEAMTKAFKAKWKEFDFTLQYAD